jgi:hypothetical protein
VLLALVLLLLLFVRMCAGGAFARREFCRLAVGTNGASPGTISSVRPSLAFGALPNAEGGRFGCTILECAEYAPHRGACPKAIESMLTSRVIIERGSEGECACLASWLVFRHDWISSSFMGLAPRLLKGAMPLRQRHMRRIETPKIKIPTTPRTAERMIIRSRC